MMCKRALFIALLLGVGGCDTADGEQAMAWQTMANACVIAAVPEGAAAEPITGGIRVRLAPGSRAEPTAELRVAGLPPGEGLQTREIDGRTVTYRLSQTEGGSGGEEVTLTAWMPCPAGHLQLRFVTQAEPPQTADLEVAWQLLARSRCG